MKKPLQPIVTDTYDFPTLIRDGDVYVDKTALLYRLISKVDGSLFFMSRPRRFGKSLMLSTLEQIFKGNRDLFKGLAIDGLKKNWEPNPVLRLDMSLVKARDAEGYNKALCSIARTASRNLECNPSSEDNPGLILSQLFDAIAARGEKLAVLIDEYDAPISGLLNKPELLEEVRTLLHDFYTVLKAHVGNICFLMMTGVSKFTKLSVFSGLNNLTDLTMSEAYASLLGYTKEELVTVFRDHVAALARKLGKTHKDTIAELLTWYDSYRFSPDNEVRVCNPVSVGRALQEQRFYGFWDATGNSTLIIERLRRLGKLPDELEGLKVLPKKLDVCDVKTLPFAALMYQGGYLTIKDVAPSGEIVLGIPNREVRLAIYDGFVEDALKDSADSFTSIALDLKRDLDAGDPVAQMQKDLISVFGMVPHEWKLKDEAEAKRYFLLFMRMAGATINAEVESSNGRADAILETSKTVYICEFKYKQTSRTALQQCYDRNYAAPFASDKRSVAYVGINYDPLKRSVDILGGPINIGGGPLNLMKGPSVDRKGPSGFGKGPSAILGNIPPEGLSRAEIAARNGMTPRSGGFKRLMMKLLAEGLLKMSNPESPHSRLQKYRITDKARALLNNQPTTLD